MGEIVWDNDERTVIRMEYLPLQTWDQHHARMEQVATMIREVEHIVDLIILFEGAVTPPSGSAISHFRRSWLSMPSNAGVVVDVGVSPILAALIHLFIRLYSRELGNKIFFAPTLEEARKIIRRCAARKR